MLRGKPRRVAVFFRLVVACWWVAPSHSLADETKAAAAPKTSARALTFEEHVAPILAKNCTACHGEKQRKAGLDLRTLPALRKGGESGEPILVAGKASESRLVELIVDGSMPPKGKPRLAESDVQLLKSWIDSGAAGTAEKGPDPIGQDAVEARQALDVLEFKCSPCHGWKKQEAGLRLLSLSDLLKGGKSGPAIVPGKAASSRLIERIQSDAMPPLALRTEVSVKPVTAGELEILKTWIDHGAVEPPARKRLVDDGRALTDADRQWWAYQPPRRPTVPKVKDAGRVRTPIDAFLLARLESAGLGFSREADRRTLLRRLTFTLTGLPPTPAEAEAFLNDPRPDAYERWVDRLLESPRYGERWAQHWLDAAGYSESDGGDGFDPPRDDYYYYRDYVIRAFNADKPFDRFVQEQIAGDELADYLRAPKMTPELADNLAATGFLRSCVDPTDRPIHSFLPDRYQVLADTVTVVDSALMGLTMGCVRCHSHKYDPLSHVDYYSLSAIFAGAYAPMDWVPARQRSIELATAAEREAARAHNAPIDARIAVLKKQVAELTESFKPRLVQYKLDQLPEAIRKDVKAALELPEEKRSPIQKYLAEKLAEHFAFKEGQLAATFPEFKTKAEPIQVELAGLEASRRTLPKARGLTDLGPSPLPFYLQRRGEPYNRGDEVGPNVPAVLATAAKFEVKPPWPGAPTSGRRLAFAKWLTTPSHPLTARVFVNRVWQQHFGVGIVATVDNFGRTGSLPTHPELLDWLATEFVARGWSVKELQKLIVTSSAFRQGSRRAAAGSADPDNRLLGRMPLRRLDAEAVRDAIHFVAGSLNLKLYGPAIEVVADAEGQVVGKHPADQARRSIYMLHRRSSPLTMLDAFDAPRMTINCTVRRTSTVASQALLLLNSEEVLIQADRMADRVENEAGAGVSPRIELAYRMSLSRGPTEAEKVRAAAFLADQALAYPAEPSGPSTGTTPPTPEHRALADFCQVLLNSPEFLYVD
jgi:mono/diheme cytochrome c family protein